MFFCFQRTLIGNTLYYATFMKKTLNSSIDDAEWLDFLQSFLSPSDHVESDLKLLFGPLKTNLGVTVVGQLGQSLDGRIATVTGRICWDGHCKCLRLVTKHHLPFGRSTR